MAVVEHAQVEGAAQTGQFHLLATHDGFKVGGQSVVS